MADVPPVFHFVFGLAPQREPMHLVHYLCLESCRQVNRPAAMCLHYRHEPYGPWWDRIRPHLSLRRVGRASAIPDPARYEATEEGRVIRDSGWTYAHEADFLRLAILLDEGGIYADMDTLFVDTLPARWFERDFVIGEEAPLAGPDGVLRVSLCNAFLVSRPRAAFARAWIARMKEVFDGTWSRHSNQEAAQLWGEMPEAIHVVPQTCFYKHAATRRGVRTLFEGYDPGTAGVRSLHLWAHLWWDAWRTDFTRVHAGEIDEAYVRTRRTTYATLARKFLD
ncbi:MAG TPA: glycosyltransferase [Casimicrobiaceae bacterium]|nr:glycosyltransferase [Casimicrobiaceae bacterium]